MAHNVPSRGTCGRLCCLTQSGLRGLEYGIGRRKAMRPHFEKCRGHSSLPAIEWIYAHMTILRLNRKRNSSRLSGICGGFFPQLLFCLPFLKQNGDATIGDTAITTCQFTGLFALRGEYIAACHAGPKQIDIAESDAKPQETPGSGVLLFCGC